MFKNQVGLTDGKMFVFEDKQQHPETHLKNDMNAGRLPPLISDVITDPKRCIDNLFADTWKKLDELKNHLGWAGFTTWDLKRCRFVARTTALIDNWWSLLVRLASPHQQTETITSRPLMLQAIGKQTRHSNQTKLTITITHAEAEQIESDYRFIAAFFQSLRSTAEQLGPIQCWCRILSQALIKYLHGRQLKPPGWLLGPS